jgi:hypothetical protein
MPITQQRLAPRLYFSRYEGHYSDDDIIAATRQAAAQIETFGETNIVGVVEIVGQYHPPKRIETSRLVAKELARTKKQIIVGLPKKNQILSEVQFRSMGMGDKLAFFDSVDEALAYARKLLAEEAKAQNDEAPC